MALSTLALILGAAGKAGQGIMTGASQIDRLTPEQKNRMKELERNQALGLLGLDEAQQQQILNQQLQPVQAAEREAFSRQAQQQQIADIGQGAAFRGQQALLEASAQARSQATQRAQDVITERDALEEAAQLRELAQIKAQRQQNLQGIAQIAGGVGDAALMGLGTSMAIKEAEGLEKKLLEAARKQETKKVEKKTEASGDFLKFLQTYGPTGAAEVQASVPQDTTFNILEQPVVPLQTEAPTEPVQQVASVNNPAIDAMVAEGRATPEEAARMMEFLGIQVPKLNEDVIPGLQGTNLGVDPGLYTASIERGLNGLPIKIVLEKPGSVPRVYTAADQEQWRQITRELARAQGL
jgi:hypothetical protein